MTELNLKIQIRGEISAEALGRIIDRMIEAIEAEGAVVDAVCNTSTLQGGRT